MSSFNYSRNLFFIFNLISVETPYLFSVFTTVEPPVYGQINRGETSYLCSDFATVELLVYVQFKFSGTSCLCLISLH